MRTEGAHAPEPFGGESGIVGRERGDDRTGARANVAPALLGRPALAAVSLQEDGGGIAFASRLIHRVLVESARERPWVLELAAARHDAVTFREGIAFAARLVAGQMRRRADWIFFMHLSLARLQQHVPAAIRRPYALMVFDVEAWDPELAPDRLRTLSGAALRVGISRYTADRVMRAHPLVGEVVPCPLALLPEMSRGEPDRSLLASLGEQVVLIAGRMISAERYKGHDELLEAWPAIAARAPRAQLVFAGRGDDIPRLRAKATELGIGERVLFTGFVSEPTLAALYERCAVFAMPSRREGFGLVYLEAMRAGVPCVASKADAAGETVVHGETGILIEGQAPRAIADAVIALLTDEHKRRRFGEAGRRRYESLFTFERFSQRLLPILAAAFNGGAR